MAAEAAQHHGEDDVTARLQIAGVVDDMRRLQDAIVDRMRADVGTRALFLAELPRDRPDNAPPPPDL
jgi:hypothetical protein